MSERAVRLDSAGNSTVEGASNRPRHFAVFVEGGRHRLSRPPTRASRRRSCVRSPEWHEQPAAGLPARRVVRRSAETPHPSCEQKRWVHLSLPVADVSRVRTTRQDRPSPNVISCATASASFCAIFRRGFCALIPALFVASTARWRLPASVDASLASTPSRTIWSP